jgi:hypothetical protein
MAEYEFRSEIIGVLAVVVGVDLLTNPSSHTSYICWLLDMLYVYLDQNIIILASVIS